MDEFSLDLRVLIPEMKKMNIPITIENIEDMHISCENAMMNGVYIDEYAITELYEFLNK